MSLPLRKRTENLSGLACLGVLLVVIVVLVGITLLNAWILMLLLGALFPVFGWETLGYGTCVLITCLLQFVGSFFGRASVNA